MTEALTYFPKLSMATRREETNTEEAGLVLNGAKVVFDKEVALTPVTLKPKKETGDARKFGE